MCHQAQDYEQSSIEKYSSLLFPLNASFIVPVTVTKAPASGKSYGYIIESGGIKFNPDGQHPVKSQLIPKEIHRLSLWCGEAFYTDSN